MSAGLPARPADALSAPRDDHRATAASRAVPRIDRDAHALPGEWRVRHDYYAKYEEDY